MTDLAKLVVRLEAEIGRYQTNLDRAEKQLKAFQRSSNNILKNVAGSIAAYFTADALVSWGKHILDNADRLDKFSQSTGVAVEDLSRLQYGLKAAGGEGVDAAKLFKELAANISEAAGSAKSEAAVAFKALGVDVRDAKGNLRDTDDVLLDLADSFSSYQDGANKSAIATQLLGKSGQGAIPFLNEGAEGIRRLSSEADRFGVTISTDLARNADEFNDRLSRMRAVLVDGLGNRIAEKLLPTLNALGEEWESNAEGLEALDHAAEVASSGFKILLTAALYVSKVFDELGTSIGGLGAAAVALVELDFRRVAQIFEDNNADIAQKEEAFQRRFAAIWRDGGDELLTEVRVTAEKIKREAPNLAAAKEIDKAAGDALKKLQDMQRQFAEQVGTFGLGDAAATKYRLTVGNLAEEVKDAGEAGRALRDSIIEQAEALDRLKDSKQIVEGLREIQSQISSIRGDFADAAVLDLDAKNAELITKLRKAGNEEGLKQYETLVKLTAAQADYSELQQRAESIQSDLAITEERLNNSRRAGAITDLQLQKQLGDARQKAAADLTEIYESEKKIADQIGSPAMEDALKRFGSNIESLKGQADVFFESFRAGVEDNVTSELLNAVKGAQSFGDAFGNIIQSIADQLVKLAIQSAVQQGIGAAIGTGTTGGGYLSSVLAAFGGGRAAGGAVLAGHAYRVNEGTPNSELFVPSTNGRIERAASSGSRPLEVNNTFILQTERGGTVSRQTQLQVGTTVARSLADAQRRNG